MNAAVYTKHLKFRYKNYNGEEGDRDVHPLYIAYRVGKEGAGHGGDYTGWVFHAWDHDKQATRTFALENIIVPEDTDLYKLIPLHPNFFG